MDSPLARHTVGLMPCHGPLRMHISERTVLVVCGACNAVVEWKPVLREEPEPVIDWDNP